MANKIDAELFATLVVSGTSYDVAYVQAGGQDSKYLKNTAHKYKNRKNIDALIKEKVQEAAVAVQIGFVGLGPLAVQHMKDVLESSKKKNPELIKDKTKVADNIIQRTRDILPKEISVMHEHSTDGSLEDSLEKIAEYLLADREGQSAKIIEAVSQNESRGTPLIEGEYREDEVQPTGEVSTEPEAT